MGTVSESSTVGISNTPIMVVKIHFVWRVLWQLTWDPFFITRISLCISALNSLSTQTEVLSQLQNPPLLSKQPPLFQWAITSFMAQTAKEKKSKLTGTPQMRDYPWVVLIQNPTNTWRSFLLPQHQYNINFSIILPMQFLRTLSGEFCWHLQGSWKRQCAGMGVGSKNGSVPAALSPWDCCSTIRRSNQSCTWCLQRRQK